MRNRTSQRARAEDDPSAPSIIQPQGPHAPLVLGVGKLEGEAVLPRRELDVRLGLALEKGAGGERSSTSKAGGGSDERRLGLWRRAFP